MPFVVEMASDDIVDALFPELSSVPNSSDYPLNATLYDQTHQPDNPSTFQCHPFRVTPKEPLHTVSNRMANLSREFIQLDHAINSTILALHKLQQQLNQRRQVLMQRFEEIMHRDFLNTKGDN